MRGQEVIRRSNTKVLSNAPAAPGVYWIKCKGEIVYVGESRNLRQRLRSGHQLAMLFDFPECSVEWHVTPNHKTEERSLIEFYRPYLNGAGWPDAYILCRALSGNPLQGMPLPRCLQ